MSILKLALMPPEGEGQDEGDMVDNKPYLLEIMPFLSPLTPTLSRKGRGSANLELRKQPRR